MALLDLYGADASHLLAIAQGADNQGWLRPYHSALREECTAYIGLNPSVSGWALTVIQSLPSAP